MMDLIRMKACTTLRITYLVLDEADRMFDMGFGEQVRQCIKGTVRGALTTLCCQCSVSVWLVRFPNPFIVVCLLR